MLITMTATRYETPTTFYLNGSTYDVPDAVAYQFVGADVARFVTVESRVVQQGTRSRVSYNIIEAPDSANPLAFTEELGSGLVNVGSAYYIRNTPTFEYHTPSGKIRQSRALGHRAAAIAAADSPYTMDGLPEVLLISASAGDVTVTLPAANFFGTGYASRVVIRRTDASTNTVTISRAGSDAVNGGTSFTLSAGAGVTLVSNGSTAWVSVEQMPQIISVSDYGARGDGSTDDTAAIQAAVSAGAGRSVFFPAGTYFTTDGITVPANTNIYGVGDASVIKSLTLVNGGSGIGHRQFDVNGVAGVRFSKLKFDCSLLTNKAAGMRCLLFRSATDYKVQDCAFLTPGAATASIGCARFEITNNDIDIQSTTADSWHDGIIDQWAGSNNFLILGNRIRANDVGQYPILVTGLATDGTPTPVYNCVIAFNTTSDSSQPGIWVQGKSGGAYDIKIIGNSVDNALFGISVSETDNFVVTGNIIRNAQNNAIKAYRENVAFGSTGARYGVIANNVIENANAALRVTIDPGSAINISGPSSYIEVASNIVSGPDHLYAVFVGGDTTRVTVTGESMAAGTTGTVVNQSSTPTLNQIPGAQAYAPTLTAVTNVSASGNFATTTRWRKDGSTVTVFGRLSVTPTAGGSATTELGISLPIASDFTVAQDCAGVATSAGGLVGMIDADATNNRAKLTFLSPNTTANIMSFSFLYLVR